MLVPCAKVRRWRRKRGGVRERKSEKVREIEGERDKARGEEGERDRGKDGEKKLFLVGKIEEKRNMLLGR